MPLVFAFGVVTRAFLIRLCVFAALCLALPLAASGCQQVVLISAYDEVTDQSVMALHKSVDGLLNQLDQNPLPEYAALKPVYDSIRGDLAALRLRNEVRPKNKLTVDQLEHLRAALADDVEAQHKSGKFNHVMVAPTRIALDSIFASILKLELAKKDLKEE